MNGAGGNPIMTTMLMSGTVSGRRITMTTGGASAH